MNIRAHIRGKVIVFLLTGAAGFWLVLAGYAQVTTGTILGTVTDATGAVLPGAKVAILNEDTGIPRTVTSDAAGRYAAPSLSLGNYRVTATLEGFQAAVRSGIMLTVGREAVVNFQLSIGAVEQSVEVTGEAPLVETTTANISSLVDDRMMRDLPLNGRDLIQLTTLNLGVTAVRNAGSSFTSNYGMKIAVAGARPTMNNFLIDGTDANDSWNRTPGSATGVMLGVETVREFSILTHHYSAEFGRAAGGVVNAVTKSGTNQLHGAVFEFLRNSALDARNFFDKEEVPPFRRNQFGFTMGGPLRRNQTFFFGSYEGLRESLTTTEFSTVPTAEARLGNLPNRAPIPVHPNIRPFLNLYPLPTVPPGRDFGDGSAEHVYAARRPADDNYVTAKIDHAFSQKDSFFVRYTRDRGGKFGPGGTAYFGNREATNNQYGTLEESRIFSPVLLNVFRLGFNHSFKTRAETALTNLHEGLFFVPGRPLGNGTVTGLAAFWDADAGLLPEIQGINVFEFIDSLTYMKAGHSLKTGFHMQRIQFNQVSPGRIGGRLRFRSLTDLLTGVPDRLEIVESGSTWDRYWRNFLTGLYVQDDWAVKPNLTLNLGLRYEFITVPREKYERISNIRDPLNDTTVTVGPPLFENPSLRNFAPRLGFAWSPGGSGKTAIRGGFGLFYDEITSLWFTTAGSRMLPFFRILDFRRPPFPDLLSGTGAATLQLNTFPFKMNTPYMIRYNLNVQQEFLPQTVLTVGYSGSRGVHVGRIADFNMAISERRDGRTFFPAGSQRRNPNFAEIRMRSADTDSFYNSLMVGVSKRYAQGLQLQASYTFSRTVDEGSGTQTAGDYDSEVGTQINWENHKMNRGLAAFHVAHNFVLTSTYDLPIGSQWTGAAGMLAKGWQIGGILSLGGGFPFTVTEDSSSSRDATAGGNRPELLPHASNNPVLGGPDKYFDASVFTQVAPGFYGNVGRNTVIGPGSATFDLSLVKMFPISEGKSLQFRSELFNLFNRANFGIPSRTVFDGSGRVGSAGRITRTTSTSRQVQFGLKFVF